jgi:hypothetical protein
MSRNSTRDTITEEQQKQTQPVKQTANTTATGDKNLISEHSISILICTFRYQLLYFMILLPLNITAVPLSTKN